MAQTRGKSRVTNAIPPDQHRYLLGGTAHVTAGVKAREQNVNGCSVVQTIPSDLQGREFLANLPLGFAMILQDPCVISLNIITLD